MNTFISRTIGLSFFVLILIGGGYVLKSLLTNDFNPFPSSKMDYWREQRVGTLHFGLPAPDSALEYAKKQGIEFIRFSPDQWPSAEQNFLIGDSSHYKTLSKVDLEKLKDFLILCEKHKLKVVLTMRTLPGASRPLDKRLFETSKYVTQAAQYWQDLARELRDFKNIVGYELLHDPKPNGTIAKLPCPKGSKCHIGQIKLRHFYKTVLKAIRLVDKDTPVILAPSIITQRPLKDPNVLYGFGEHVFKTVMKSRPESQS